MSASPSPQLQRPIDSAIKFNWIFECHVPTSLVFHTKLNRPSILYDSRFWKKEIKRWISIAEALFGLGWEYDLHKQLELVISALGLRPEVGKVA